MRKLARLDGWLLAAGKEGGCHEEDKQIGRRRAKENRKDEPTDGQGSSAPGTRRRGGEQEAGRPSSAALRVVCLFLESPPRAGWRGVLHPAFCFTSTDRRPVKGFPKNRVRFLPNSLESTGVISRWSSTRRR